MRDEALLEAIGNALEERRQALAVMESLTGGLLSSAITDISDSSRHLIGGVVAYSADIKALVGVPRWLMDRYGIISEETARAMAHAIREFFHADIGIGITGVAGPGDQEGKPAGTIHIAVDGPDGVLTCMCPRANPDADRQVNKHIAVEEALRLLKRYLEQNSHRGKEE
jgi:nicotinamide-nucleotide amidase